MTLVIVCLLAVTLTNAQNNRGGKLIVHVLSEAAQGMENATVELLKARDSSLVKAAITDKAGMAELEPVQLGSYLLRITMINYSRYYSHPLTLTAEQPVLLLPAISLTPARDAQMKAVTVTARKPFIQKLSDRIVVNVDNSIVNVGSSALDILERSPGVLIDPNDVISLRGRAGVIIMIDGKVTPCRAPTWLICCVVYLPTALSALTLLPTRLPAMMRLVIRASLISG
ncbi:carboxypeptidase-like regulatory domain-containing protein [Paraflavitalea speifideaquila]|uniref:carboxypeptidase-like regulatory domain-containing protein n=1 Tax=Paraflavitalea speifideaquila TaxID=3076558 RepID=UPI0028F01A89|nr:carboxypeptidase-like regulatory domain-containing protein [Paraflavitalea speifideiaquila]